MRELSFDVQFAITDSPYFQNIKQTDSAEPKQNANDYAVIRPAYQEVIKENAILFPIYRDLGAVVKRHASHFASTLDAPLKGLDFGCGPGTSTPQILRTFNGLKVNINLVGIDRDAGNIDIARTENNQIKYEKIEENKIPDFKAAYDVIFCFFVLLEQESREKLAGLFLELHRVLKPNGRIFTVNCNEWLYNPQLDFLYEDNKVEGNQEVYDAKKSGSRIGLRSIGDDGKEVIFRDFFWTRGDYKNAANEADLELLEEYIPKGLDTDGKDWKEGDILGAYHIQIYGPR